MSIFDLDMVAYACSPRIYEAEKRGLTVEATLEDIGKPWLKACVCVCYSRYIVCVCMYNKYIYIT